ARRGDSALAQPAEPRVEWSYAAVIRPLLDAKCSACHDEKKQKAGLSLATPETIQKGGRHGSPLDPAAPAKSLMLARIDLALDDATLRALADFPALRRLDVRGTAIGDAGIAALEHHAALAELVLSQNKLTDLSVESLLSMPALERVHLWRSGLTAEAIARLR